MIIEPSDLQAAAPYLRILASWGSGELFDAEVFIVKDGEHVVGAYAIRVNGADGWLLAGSGRDPQHDLTAEILPRVEAQLRARGAERILVRTRRAGLVKKLDGAGYALDSTILVKPL